MVVAYYEVYAEGLRIGYLLVSLDAAVENNHELHILLGNKVDNLVRDAVALLISGGNIEIEFGVEILKIAVHKRHGRSAIHVIVAVHKYFLLRTHSSVKTLYGLIHVGHEEGVVEVTERRMKEALGGFDCGYATLYQKVAHRRAVGKTARKLGAELLLFGRQ